MSLHLPQVSVHFLGTGGSWPSAQRNVAATAVKRGGDILLFDCGEGTQRQFQKGGLSYQAVNHIFISHLHGDHVYGLPGLLKTMELNDRQHPLDVHGPPGIQDLMAVYDRIANVHNQFPVRVHEVRDGDRFQIDPQTTVRAARMRHGAYNLGYAVEEGSRPGRFDKPKALSLGVPEGPLFRKLQMGGAVKLKDDRVVTPEMVLGPARPGRTIAVSGDTAPCQALTNLARGADLFICEATYAGDMPDKAEENLHMTAGAAAEAARDAGVRRLVLTHISPRYTNADRHLDEARRAFAATTVAEDFSSVEVPLGD